MTLKLYTMDEAASIFRVKKRVFAEFIADKPFYRVIGRAKLFTDQDIVQLYEAMACPSNSASAATPPTGTSAALSEASEAARVAALMKKRLQRKSGRSGIRKSREVVSVASSPSACQKRG
jgi:hypothetical protein